MLDKFSMKENNTYKICSRCIYDSNTPGISFDEYNICNYCHQVEDLEKQFGTGKSSGIKAFEDNMWDSPFA